jgi:hypothetical protein
MKKIIFSLLSILLLSLVLISAQELCTPESSGYICEQYNCGGSWNCILNCDPISSICSYEKSISQGTSCDIFESCQDCIVCIAGCNCNFYAESTLMTWGDSAAVLRLADKYPDKLQENLFRLLSLSVLNDVAPEMLKEMMEDEYNINLEIGEDTTVKLTEDGHLVSSSLSLDFDLNNILNTPKIELTEKGFMYENNLIEGLDIFGTINVDFEPDGINAAIFENTFDLFIPLDETTIVTGQGTKGLEVKGGNFKLNGKLDDGRDFDFSNSNAEELYVDFSTQTGYIVDAPSLNIGGKDIVGTEGIKTEIYFGKIPPDFSKTSIPKIWLAEDGDVRTQGKVEFHDSETGFNYKGTGEGVIADYSKETNKIKIDNPLGKKDVAVVTGIVNGDKEVEVIITMVDGIYKFEASAYDIAGLSSDINYNMDTLSIFIDDYESIAKSNNLGDIEFDIYEGDTKLNTITLKTEERASTPDSKSNVVESGDTLWDIAEELLGDGNLWTKLKIYDKNGNDITEDILKNPTSLEKGMTISTGDLSITSSTEILLTGTSLPDFSGITYSGLNSNPNPNSITVKQLTQLMEYYSENVIVNRKCNCGDRCDEYAASIVKHSSEKGIDPVLTFSIIMQESGCDETPPPGANVGMMQIYKGSSDLLNYDKNIDAGTDILVSKYDTYVDEDGKEFTCNGETITYHEWEVAVRAYNGWGCSGGNLNYVEEVSLIYNDAKEKAVQG